MFDTKIRRILAALSLATVCSLFTVSDLQAAQARSSRRAPVMETASLSFWRLLSNVWEKASVRIDDNGNKASVRIDDNGRKASVRIDDNGARVTVLQDKPGVRPQGDSPEGERN